MLYTTDFFDEKPVLLGGVGMEVVAVVFYRKGARAQSVFVTIASIVFCCVSHNSSNINQRNNSNTPIIAITIIVKKTGLVTFVVGN